MSSAPSPGGPFALNTATLSTEEGTVFDSVLTVTAQGDHPPTPFPQRLVSNALTEGVVPAGLEALVVTLFQNAPAGPKSTEPEAPDGALHELSALLHAQAAPASSKEVNSEEAAPLLEPETPSHLAEAHAGAFLAQQSATPASPLGTQAPLPTDTTPPAALGPKLTAHMRSANEGVAGVRTDPLPERESDIRLTQTELPPPAANEATRGPRSRGATAIPVRALLPSSPPPKLLDQVRVVLGPQLNQALIRLDPPGLGALRVHVQEADGELSAQIEVEQPEVLREIERLLPQLHDAFTKHGQAVGRIEVSLNTTGFTAQTDGHAQPGHDPTGNGADEFGSPQTDKGPNETVAPRKPTPPTQGLDTLA